MDPSNSNTNPVEAAGSSGGAGDATRPETTAGAVGGEDLQDRMLGEFRLLRRLGRGGMAEVYLAEQTSLHRQVAVKVLRADKLAETDDVLLRRFEQEARAAAALTHPNIVQVYSIGHQDGIHYIAQEYVQGFNLKEYLKKKGAPELPLALHFMKQIAAALQKAGEAGIVHRDIKPENIMINRKGVAKVADFGLAQLTQAGDKVNLTQVGVTMGTPLYMSPEQVNGHKLDHRSDLYSFGVTCYHMLAGRPPFRGETALSVAVQHLKNDPEPLQTVRPDLPPALCQIVRRLMAKSPADRYPDAQTVLRDLRKLDTVRKQSPDAAGQLSLGPTPSSDSGRLDRLAWRISGWSIARRTATYAALCLLAALPAAGLGWLLRPGNPLRTPPPSEFPFVPKEKVENQYTDALIFEPDNEYAWQAVIDKFDDPAYETMAQENLALLWLRRLRLDEAEPLFHKLTESVEPRWQAAGFAGEAIIANLRADQKAAHGERDAARELYQRSQTLIDGPLQQVRGSLDRNSDLSRYVEATTRRNHEQLGTQAG